MTAKKRFYFLHLVAKDIDTALSFMRIKDLPFTENLVWDEENPDYLVVTDKALFDPRCAEKLYDLVFREDRKDDSRQVRFFFTEEAVFPDFNIFDYAICWNWNLSYQDRVARIPAYFFYDIKNFASDGSNNLTIDEAHFLLKDKHRFCNFLYSNGNAHPMRDQLFHALCDYRLVDSLGPHLNNVNTLLSATGGEVRPLFKWFEFKWLIDSINIKKHYKFSIAAENTYYDGYTSEKILSSFMAHTVPIYCGNPYIAEEYNPEAFVNCNDYDSLEDVVRRVKEIDENDDLWAYMVSRQWQTDEQLARAEAGFDHYKQFMTNIFTQPLDKAIRRPSGTTTNFVRKFFSDALPKRRTLMQRITGLIKEPSRIPEVIAKRVRKPMPVMKIDDFFKD